MDRDEAVDTLPPAYQQVLRMLDAGRSVPEIAAALDVEADAVGPLIELAVAKLARARGDLPAADEEHTDGQ